MDEALIRQAALEMAGLLETRLADFHAQTVVLDRDEAALILGLVSGIAEQLAGTNPEQPEKTRPLPADEGRAGDAAPHP